MAACGISAVSGITGRSFTVSSTSGGSGRGGGGALHITASKCSFSTHFPSYSSEASMKSGQRGAVKAFARHGIESAKDVGLLYPEISSPSTSTELEVFQTGRWSDEARDGLATLHDDTGRSAREAFATRGEITEVDMDRLVDTLLQEGQSAKDYQRRAIFFNLIAEFFQQGKAFSAENDDSRTSMQTLVDLILAEDGRSATDYNARAQFFAKSAEVFPFKAEVGQI
ncbi:unnamed protein product [Calypogeia fissa]